MARRFDGQVAWITGGGSGIGRAVALELARQGANVAVSGRRLDRLQEVVAELEALGARGLAVPCDVTDEAQVHAACETVVRELGRLDLCFANAGFGVAGRLDKVDADGWRRQLETNVIGVAMTCRAALPHLQATRGRLALLGSVIVYGPAPGSGPYTASKAAVHAMATTLYAEQKRHGVSCTVVHPGFVASEIGQVDNQGRFDPSRKDRRPARLIVPTDRAARAIVRAVHARRREAIITGHGKLIAFLGRYFPGLVAWLLARFA